MSIQLKVLIAKTGALKTMMFDGRISVGDACKEIKEKIEEGGSDHGLYLTGDEYTNGKWLEMGKTINFYDLRSGDQVEFKKKHRPLRVTMMDKNTKTVLVDDSMIVQDMLVVICEHVNLDNPEEWGLKDPRQDHNMWLNPNQTLGEQGVEAADPVILKQRFHYTDHTVDTSNPYRLNLLYEQCRDSIVSGEYPVTQDEAVQFAAMQCQVILGDHKPNQHKPGFLDLASYVPPEYVKLKKKIETKIWAEHRTLATLSEINAKYRYFQLCRSLKTYGVTFYKIKEQAVDSKGRKKKGKLVDRLLGITRDKIVRLDNDTKEVISSYDLHHLRRWAASNNSFTFDFGDYEEAYYSVQTDEGESMSQVIAGYIDIILKRQKEAAEYVHDDDDEQVGEEETIAPRMGQAVSRTPGAMKMATEVRLGGVGSVDSQRRGVIRSSVGGSMGQMQAINDSPGAAAWNGNFSRGAAGEAESFTPTNANVLNSAGLGGLLKDLEGAFSSVNAACNDLNLPLAQNDMGDDPAAQQWRKQTMQATRQQLRAHANGMTIATAMILSSSICMDTDDFDPDMLANACKALGAHVSQLATLGRSAASLSDDATDCEKLLATCRELSAATKRLVAAANGAAGGLASGIIDASLRDELLNNAQIIGTQIAALLARAGAGEVDAAGQNQLHDAMARVTAATKKVVGESKTTAQKVDGDQNKALVITSAKALWTTTSQLLAVTKVVAPTITMPKSMEQLNFACQAVQGSAGRVIGDSKTAGADAESMGALSSAVNELAGAINDLLNVAKTCGEKPDYTEEFARAAANVAAATKQLEASVGNPQAIIDNVKLTGGASSQMVKIAKAEAASETDPNIKKMLLDAARRLADATTSLVNAAKVAAANPNDPDAQADLVSKTRALDALCADMSNNAQRRVAVRNLVAASKEAAAATTQLIQATKPAAQANSNAAAAQAMIASAKEAAGVTTKLVSAVKVQQMSPAESALQGKLITAATATAVPCSKLVQSVKGAAGTVTDNEAKANLGATAKDCSLAMQQLIIALKAAKAVCGGLEFDGALDAVENAKSSLGVTDGQLTNHRLQPEFGQTLQTTSETFMLAASGVNNAISEMLVASQERDAATAGIQAKDAGAAMGSVAEAVRGVAACMPDPAEGHAVINAALAVAATLSAALISAKASAAKPDDDAMVDQVLTAVGECQRAIDSMTSTLPGQREIEAAIGQIQSAALGGVPPADSSRSAKDLQDEFGTQARILANAQQRLLTVRDPEQLGIAAVEAGESTVGILAAANQSAANAGDDDLRNEILDATAGLVEAAVELLSAAGAAGRDPGNDLAEGRVDDASMAVSAALNGLGTHLQSAGPGQAECNEAMKAIQTATASLEGNVPPSLAGKTYLELHKIYKASSRELGHTTSSTVKTAKSDPDSVGACAVDVQTHTVAVTEAAAAAAALVGDGGKITITQFLGPASAIRQGSNQLKTSGGQAKAIISGCTAIARSTQAIINASKAAARQVEDQEASDTFLALAKEVAGKTSATVAAGKLYAQDASGANETAVKEKTAELDATVSELEALAERELDASAATPAMTAAKNKLIHNAKGVASEVNSLLSAVKIVAASPDDVRARQTMNVAVKGIQTAMTALSEAFVDGAPGAAECSEAMGAISTAISDIDTAEMSSSLDDLEALPGQTADGCSNDLLAAAKKLTQCVVHVVDAARSKPHELGPAASSVGTIMPDFAENAVGVAATDSDVVRQQEILGLSRGVAEATLELVMVAKEVGGDADEVEGQMRLDQAAKDVSQAVGFLLNELRGAIEGSQEIMDAVDAINNKNADLSPLVLPGLSQADAYSDLASKAKALAGAISKLSSTAKAQPDKVGPQVAAVAEAYPIVVDAARAAAGASEDDAAKNQLSTTTEAVGSSTVALLQAVSALSSDKKNFQKQQAVSTAARGTNTNVAKLISATKTKPPTVRACEDAIDAVSACVHDMETAAMFASAGQLDREEGSFDDFAGALVAAAQQLASDTQALVTEAQNGGDKIGDYAKASGSDVEAIANNTKGGAATLGDKAAQASIFSAATEASNKTSTLLSAAMSVSLNPRDASVGPALLEAASQLDEAIRALISTTDTVQGEASQGIRAVHDAADTIETVLASFQANKTPDREGSVEEMVDASRVVAAAAASLVSAIRTTPQALKAAADSAKEGVVDLLSHGKAAAADSDDAAAKGQVYSACEDCAKSAAALLDIVKTCGGFTKDSAVSAAMAEASKEVASSVASVVEGAKALRKDYFDPNDPNAVAERELLAAAASIEAAAAKLAMLKPKPPPDAPDMDLAFEEQILEAAKAIAAATGALVKAATLAQRELVAAGKASSKDNVYHVDATWQEGLVSAAKAVAGSTNQLCNAANDAAKGEASETALIAAADGVAANTAHLVAAARAKAIDPNSASQAGLKNAARAVKNATSALVESAKAFTEAQNEMNEGDVMMNAGELTDMERIRLETEARERVLILQAELERAQNNVTQIHKARYTDSNAAAAKPKPAKPTPPRTNTAVAPPKPSPNKPATPKSKPATPTARPKPSKPAPRPGAKPAPKPGKPAPKPAAAAPAAAAASSGGSGGSGGGGATYSLEQLQSREGLGAEVDMSQLEQYLSDADFEATFGMSKDAFNGLAGWKRTNEKKKHNLY